MYLNENCVLRNPEAVTAEDIARALDADRAGRGWVAKCPAHHDRNASFSISDVNGKVLVHCFAGCSQTEVIEALRSRGLWPENDRTALPDPVQRKLAEIRRAERERAAAAANAKDSAQRQETALYLWGQTRPADGTVVETYLKWRGIRVSPPATLRYLPARPPKYPFPSMVAAFGIASEPEPGLVTIPRAHIHAIHITTLAPDGQGKAAGVGVVKRIVGSPGGFPIVLAPPNDGLGLAIAEGIETAFSYHQATGLGAWAAGAAGFMPALAEQVPDFIESVTICGEADPAGRRGALELADRLVARGFEVLIAEASHGG